MENFPKIVAMRQLNSFADAFDLSVIWAGAVLFAGGVRPFYLVDSQKF